MMHILTLQTCTKDQLRTWFWISHLGHLAFPLSDRGKPREMESLFSCFGSCPLPGVLEWELTVCLSQFCIQWCHMVMWNQHGGRSYTIDIGKCCIRTFDPPLLSPWKAGCYSSVQTPCCLVILLWPNLPFFLFDHYIVHIVVSPEMCFIHFHCSLILFQSQQLTATFFFVKT